MAATSLPIEPSLSVRHLDKHLSQYTGIAALTILIWDWLSCLADEVEFIWCLPSGMSGRPLYLMFRYGGTAFELYNVIQVVGVHSREFCKWYMALLPVGTFALLYLADVLLSYRALCLWRMKKSILLIHSIIFVLVVIISIFLLVATFTHVTVAGTPPGGTGCVVQGPAYTFAAPVPGLLFEVWTFILVLVRAIKFSKERRSKPAGRVTNILKLLIRDAMWWFGFIFCLLVANAICFALERHSDSGFFLPLTRAFIVVMGCRMVVHLRKACYDTDSPPPWHVASRPRRDSTGDYSFSPTSEEASRLGRVIILAQRAGLPPALPADFDAFWDDPIRTQNHDHVVTSGIELSSVLPAQAPHLDISLPSARFSILKRPSSHIDIDMEWQPPHLTALNTCTQSRSKAIASAEDIDGMSSPKALSNDTRWRATETLESLDYYDDEDAKTAELFISPITWAELERPKTKGSMSASGSGSGSMVLDRTRTRESGPRPP